MKLFGLTLASVISAASIVISMPAAQATDITGAGATFPAAIYAKWSEAYAAATGNQVNYQAIGSGGGIKQIKAKTVDFGASDMPLEPEELTSSSLIQWPQIVGGVVPVVNIPGVEAGKMKLTGPVIADIYLGKITKWNDKAIVDLNKGLKLPDLDITPVYRSDGSGTTYNFTYYLGSVSPEWKDKVGVDKSVKFPVGQGGKGNPGVAANVGNTVGAIGYVDYADAKNSNLVYTEMQNKEGVFLEPDGKSFAAAAANADWKSAPNFRLILANQPGKDSWPMTAASFILMQKTQDKPETAKAVLSYFDYSFKNGGKAADALAFVAIPANVVALIEKTWSDEIKGPGNAAVWP